MPAVECLILVNPSSERNRERERGSLQFLLRHTHTRGNNNKNARHHTHTSDLCQGDGRISNSKEAAGGGGGGARKKSFNDFQYAKDTLTHSPGDVAFEGEEDMTTLP